MLELHKGIEHKCESTIRAGFKRACVNYPWMNTSKAHQHKYSLPIEKNVTQGFVQVKLS
jgi:hypothetical protein